MKYKSFSLLLTFSLAIIKARMNARISYHEGFTLSDRQTPNGAIIQSISLVVLANQSSLPLSLSLSCVPDTEPVVSSQRMNYIDKYNTSKSMLVT